MSDVEKAIEAMGIEELLRTAKQVLASDECPENSYMVMTADRWLMAS